MFCGCVYIYPQIWILYAKNFFAHQLKQKQKSHVIFKGTAVSLVTLYIHAFSIQITAMFVYGSIEDHTFDGMSNLFKRCFYLTKKVFLDIKNKLVEKNSINFWFTKRFTL